MTKADGRVVVVKCTVPEDVYRRARSRLALDDATLTDAVRVVMYALAGESLPAGVRVPAVLARVAKAKAKGGEAAGE